MKAVRFSTITKVVLGAVLCLLVFPAQFWAQEDPFKKKGGGGKGGGTAKPRPSAPGPARTRTVTVYKDRPVTTIKTVIQKVEITPTTASLAVSVGVSGATITVEGQSKNGKTFNAFLKEEGEISAIFNKLPPGLYRVTADLDGYRLVTKDVTMKAGQQDKLDLLLQPITHDVVITLNVSAGQVMYQVGEEDRVARIQANRAVLQNLHPGTYKIRIFPEDKGYRDKEDFSITVPEGDTSSNHSDDVSVKVDLDKRPAAEPFSWSSANDWILPNGWPVAEGKITLNGPGMALPRKEEKRNYDNFRLVTSVRLLNGVAVSFVLRLVDEKNYYLVQLTGANAEDPFQLRGFIVQNGARREFGNSANIRQFAETMKLDKFFEVTLTMKDNRIAVALFDTETAEDINLGILTDPNPKATFSIGAVGLNSGEKEQTVIEKFQICVLGQAGCPAPNW